MPTFFYRKENIYMTLPCGKEVLMDKKKIFIWLNIHKKKCDQCKDFNCDDEIYKSSYFEKVFNRNNFLVREK